MRVKTFGRVAARTLAAVAGTLCIVSVLGSWARAGDANSIGSVAMSQVGKQATPAVDDCEKTPADNLLLSAQQGALERVQQWLACGEDPNGLWLWREDFSPGENNWGELLATPLHAAAWHGHTTVVAALIEAGAEVNQLDEWDLSILITAAEQNQTAVAQQLIEAGAEVNFVATCAQCIDESALTIAASRGYADMVSLLLEADADTTHRDRTGQTALELAVANQYPQVVELLKAEMGAEMGPEN